MTEQLSSAGPEPYNRRRVNSLLIPWTHPLGDFMAVTAWFWTTAKRFPGDTMILYALTAYFMMGIYIHWKQVNPIIARGWPILLLPLYAIFSFLWSDVPDTSFKITLQLLLSALICCYIAARVSQRAFILAVFFALTYWEIMSINGLSWHSQFSGAFADKNYLALRMSILAFAAAAIALDDGYHRYVRWAAPPIALLAFYMILRSGSATSTVAGAMGLAIIVGAAWVWRPMKGYRALLIAAAVAVVAAVVMIVGQDPTFDPMAWFLGKLGKDSTLTGRHELWEYANQLIEQRPFLGLGPGGFWLPDRQDAQMLLDTHYKPRGTAFSFHNSYIEIAVYLGLTGLVLGMVGWLWSAWINISRVVSRATLPSAFFGALTMVAAVRSYVESDLWQPFEFAQMIVWIGALGVLARQPTATIGMRKQPD